MDSKIMLVLYATAQFYNDNNFPKQFVAKVSVDNDKFLKVILQKISQNPNKI